MLEEHKCWTSLSKMATVEKPINAISLVPDEPEVQMNCVFH